MPMWMALSFQDTTSPSMEHILFFHDHTVIVLLTIVVMTFYLMIFLSLSKNFNKFVMEGQEIETIWTILPAGMLMFIAFPSLKTLYLMEDTKIPDLTIKTMGHQWYWSYEYTNLSDSEIDSFMQKSNSFRLLKTEEVLKLPVKTSIRNMVTSADVIHSWTIPSMGVKSDALPGRLNQVHFISKRLGLFTGQCSEICGSNHSFMPVFVMISSLNNFMGLAK